MNNKEMIDQYDKYIIEFEKQIHSNELPSKKWYAGCGNRNDEICEDKKFESMYDWLKVDEKKSAKEYRGMVNEFRKRCGMEEIV